MNQNRRDFLRAGPAAAGAALAYCGAVAPAHGEASAVQAPFSLMLQLSGLIVHGSWPAETNKPEVLTGWDVLMLKDGHHVPELRIPIRNLVTQVGVVRDRFRPDVAVWNLANTDVLIKLDGTPRGSVAAVVGKRPVVNGVPAPCPNPNQEEAKDDEFLDITWLADLDRILGDGTPRGHGTLKDELKVDAGQLSAVAVALLAGRVRLSRGTIACAKPSQESRDKDMFGFVNMQNYPTQFNTDLTRFTSDLATRISLELIPFGKHAGPTIELAAAPGESTIVGYVEHMDPHLAGKVLAGTVTSQTFWKYHFKPVYKLLKDNSPRDTEPVPSCCSGGCEPPFYCVPERGYFR